MTASMRAAGRVVAPNHAQPRLSRRARRPQLKELVRSYLTITKDLDES